MTSPVDGNNAGAIPEWLRENLPEELQGMRLVGMDVAGITDSARVYGPPGAGKTTYCTVRLIVVADHLDLYPRDITVCTFRTSQANNIRENVVKWGVFPDDSDFEFWTTTHAVAARATGFLDPFDAYSDSLEGMVNDKAKGRFSDELGITFDPDSNDTQWGAFYSLYTYSKQNLLDVGEWRFIDADQWDFRRMEEDTLAWRKLTAFREAWSKRPESFSDAVAKWERFKRRHNVFDFYEQLEAALCVDASLPPLELLVVDEFHDAYPLMGKLCEKWIDNAEVVLIAGDPDQCINAFNGAHPEIFERLDARVDTDLPVIHLPKSHRVPDEHYEAAASELRETRTVPALETAGRGQFIPHTHTSFEERETGEWKLPSAEEKGSPPWLWAHYGPEIRFLTRTRAQLKPVGAHLDRYGIVYDSQAGVAGDWEFRLRVMRALKLVAGVRPSKQASVTNADQYDGSGREYDRVGGKKFSLAEATTLVKHTDARSIDDKSELWFKIAETRGKDGKGFLPVETFTRYVKDSWWDRYGNGRESIDELVYVSDRDKASMKAAWTRYDGEAFTMDLARGTRLLTIHAAKGDEAPDVVLYDGVTKRINDQVDEYQDVKANEHRTWYVALTRASERLHIVRDVHEWTIPYLDEDLEPVAAAAARRAAKHGSDGSTGGEQA